MRRQIGRAVSAICSLPYPMLLGRKPIAIATMARNHHHQDGSGEHLDQL
jgi:hypothetical protein